MSVLAAIAVLAILILVHELGHFIAARSQGIHVNNFSLGFGPALWKYQGKETIYALRAIPLGGYVGFPDDDPDSNIPKDDPNLLRNRPILDRAIVISAGVIANLIFAYFLLVGQATTIGFQQSFKYEPGVLIPEILSPESSAAIAGIQPADVVLAVNGNDLVASEQGRNYLKETIQKSPLQPLTLKIERNNQIFDLKVTPDAQGKIGVKLSPNGEPIRRRATGIVDAFTLGAQEFQRVCGLTVKGFGQLITNFKDNAQQVAGPVAIVAVGAQLAKDNLANLFQFAALISINLAVINILPLPALDGGQLAFLLIEGLLGKPLPSQIQDTIMQTGLFLLLGLGVFLIFRDTANLAIF